MKPLSIVASLMAMWSVVLVVVFYGRYDQAVPLSVASGLAAITFAVLSAGHERG